jgi:hypothetical protein
MHDTNLRPLETRDQLAFVDWNVGSVPFARRVTAMLARCTGLPEQEVASLTVGEREALLLHLRHATFGERMQCVLECPHPTCRARMDLELMVPDLLLPPAGDAQCIHETSVDGYHVRFRLPGGADQEAVAALAQTDDSEAVKVLLGRCIVGIEQDGEKLEEIPSAVSDSVSDAMALLDPQAELVLEPLCPACGNRFRAILDTASFFFTELAARARALLGEVHVLASFYHWNEEAILSIPECRRKVYLDLVEAALSRRVSA